MNASSLMDTRILSFHSFLSDVAVGIHNNVVSPPEYPHNTGGICVYDSGVVAQIIPHLE